MLQAYPIIKLRRVRDGSVVSKVAGSMGRALATPLRSLATGGSHLQLQIAGQVLAGMAELPCHSGLCGALVRNYYTFVEPLNKPMQRQASCCHA